MNPAHGGQGFQTGLDPPWGSLHTSTAFPGLLKVRGEASLTFETATRLIHVAAGFAGLVLGPIVMRALKRAGLHTRVGGLYFAMVTVSCMSAAVLAVLDWARLGFFFWIAVGTYAFALPGYLAARKRGRGWLLIHVVGVTSSYVAMVTAFLVNNFQRITGISGIPFAVRALVPMFFGTCAVIWAGYQVHLGTWPTSPGRPHKL